MIIGFSGAAGAGKDTAADYVVSRLPHFRKLAFADPLKDMLRVGLGLDKSQLSGSRKNDECPRYGLTPREIMQTLGTDWGRDMIGRDVWVKSMEARMGSTPTVISDVRFQNEADFVRERGILVHIYGRYSLDNNQHVSEAGVRMMPGDLSVSNEGSLNDLYGRLEDAIIHSYGR